MSDPTGDLQAAIVAWLKADAGVSAIIGARIYDSVPPSPIFPYLTIGEDQVVPEQADCYDGAQVHLTIHVWTRDASEPGFPPTKRLGAAIHAALNLAPLELIDHRLIEIRVEDTHYLRDPDGLTRHGVLVFKALTHPR